MKPSAWRASSTLGLIALTYGLAIEIVSYGFLAVFAAGLSLRHVEHLHNRDPLDVPATVHEAAESPAKSSAYTTKAVLDFTLDIERLAELTVMLIIGSLLSLKAVSFASLGIALTLIFVVRPVAVWLTTAHLSLTRTQRRFAAWFGIRGIGSLYYLTYAISHGAADGHADDLALVVDATLVTIALSVVLHGSSATPFMRFYRRATGRGRPGGRLRIGADAEAGSPGPADRPTDPPDLRR